MNGKILSLSAITFALSISCIAQKKNSYILDENFDSNKIGWVEESTNAHKTEVKDGFYYIYSIDTSKEQSSAGPKNISFLWGMPKAYEITSSFQIIDQMMPPHFGIILGSSTLEYKFSFSHANTGEVREWDYNRDSEIRLFTKSAGKEIDLATTQVVFRIKVADSHFEFYINDELIGYGQFNAKSWEDIRLYTTSGSAIRIDYLRIQKNGHYR
jgi:hypothetical protein